MDKKEFKNITHLCLKRYGFQKGRKDHFLDLEELFIKFKLLKSNFSEGYYLDYGIFIKDRYPDRSYTEINIYDAEIRSRIGERGKANYFYEYENLTAQWYEEFLSKQLPKHFDYLKTNGKKNLKTAIKRYPNEIFVVMPSLEERSEWSPSWRK